MARDETVVKKIIKDPLAIYGVLDREAEFAMSVKPLTATP
jgi:hypothetical protein